jgi:hypothetical protein
MIVLSRGRGLHRLARTMTNSRRESPVGCRLEQELAWCSLQGQHQIAYDSGHNIQVTEPHLIVAAVRRFAEKVTQGR